MRDPFTFTSTMREDPRGPEEIRSGILRMIVDLAPAPPPPITFIESEMATKREEDWSKCRSPSRAMRRRKMGHRQNVVTREIPCAVVEGQICYCHPEILKKIKAATKAKIDNDLDRMIMDAILGRYHAKF